MKPLIWILSVLIVLIAAYHLWADAGKDYSSLTPVTTRLPEITVQGRDAGKGNMLAFQPYLEAADYCDEQHFRDALAPLFDRAKADSLIKQGTIVVLPADIGNPLVFAEEKAIVYQADSIRQATAVIVNSNIFTFIKELLASKTEDKIRHALFKMKAASMARIYQETFSGFAQAYHVTIVAGSIILPQPSVNAAGRLVTGDGPLYNTSFVFDRDGKMFPGIVQKRALSRDEKPYVAQGAGAPLAVVPTPSGNLLVMFPSDGGATAASMKLKAVPGLIALPSANPDSTEKIPPQNDLMARITRMGIRNGIQVFLAGNFWENHPRGIIRTLQNSSLREYPVASGVSRIVNIWLQ